MGIVTNVLIPYYLSFDEDTLFIDWMIDNVGKFDVDWTWESIENKNMMVSISDSEKATLVALRLSGK
jgi:hypothetical protein